MKEFLMLEIATEVAWQVLDQLENSPRAESRWQCVRIAQDIIKSGLIDENTEDIDEVIDSYLMEIGL